MIKIDRVVGNNRKKAFEVTMGTQTLPLPYARLELEPTSRDPVARTFVEPRRGRAQFTYVLRSGRQSTVHIDDLFDYNDNPHALRDRLLSKLVREAQKRMKSTRLSIREIARRLGTSPAQLYRLLGDGDYDKSMDQVVSLLQVLDCEIDLIVR